MSLLVERCRKHWQVNGLLWFIIHGLSEHLGPKGQVSHGLCFSPLTLPKKDTGGIVLQQPELSDSLDSSLNAWHRDRMPLSKTTIFGSAASRASSQSFRAWAKPRQGKTWKNYANSSLPSKDVSMSTYRQPQFWPETSCLPPSIASAGIQVESNTLSDASVCFSLLHREVTPNRRSKSLSAPTFPIISKWCNMVQ